MCNGLFSFSKFVLSPPLPPIPSFPLFPLFPLFPFSPLFPLFPLFPPPTKIFHQKKLPEKVKTMLTRLNVAVKQDKHIVHKMKQHDAQ